MTININTNTNIKDTELESWQREWRDQPEPLPGLKKKIRRQNRQMIAGAVTISLCMAVSAAAALRYRSSFISGFAAGLWFAGLFAGGYAWWVRRGAWKPAAQTTLAYAELSYKRAIANARTKRFLFYFLLTTILAFASFLIWHWKPLSIRDMAIVAALVAELFYLGYLWRRARQSVETTKELLDHLKE